MTQFWPLDGEYFVLYGFTLLYLVDIPTMRYSTAASILFLEGLASSGLQMITIRQTVPFVGSSVLTTSIVISCFLAALALGYFRGGRHTQTSYSVALVRNLTIATMMLGVGLSYGVVALFFDTAVTLTSSLPILGSPLAHLTAFSLLVMSPLVYLLGQTVPLLLHASRDDESKSESAGNATALSTVGNVLGCLLTSLVLMYFLGVGYSIFINCLILATCVAMLVSWRSAATPWIFTCLAAGLISSYFLNVRLTDAMFEETTPYSNFQVVEREDGRSLIINRSNASFIDIDTRAGWPYIETMKRALFTSEQKAKEILVLGAGGFTLTAAGSNGADVTYVDVDMKMKAVAEEHFLKQQVNGQFVVEDARNFLLTRERKWDAIVIDLYTNASTIPMHTATYEFAQLVNSRLKPEGRVILNIVANPLLEDPYSSNLDYTIRSAYSRCITDITSYENSLVNIVYFCAKRGPVSPGSVATLYKDDTTRVAIDGYLQSMKSRRTDQ